MVISSCLEGAGGYTSQKGVRFQSHWQQEPNRSGTTCGELVSHAGARRHMTLWGCYTPGVTLLLTSGAAPCASTTEGLEFGYWVGGPG
jgi:hypothetical protein